MLTGRLLELNEASKVKKLQIKSLVVDPTSTTEPESTSLCVTLENQKSKYLKMIDRLSQENKKKAQSIDSLKTQLDFIRKALGMAGLEVDLQELQTLEVEKEEDASGTSKAQTQGAAAGVPIEVVSIPLMAQVKNKAPEVCIEKTLVPHPPANDTSNKVMESLASIGKSYIHHLLYTRKLEGDSIKLKERVEAELGKDSPFADAFTTVALKTEGNKSSSHQQALQVASQPNQIPLVNETSTDSEPQKKSWIAKKKAEFNKKAPLPPISGSQGDLISSSNESAPSESGKTFMTEAFNHSKTELLLRPVELGTDFADDISVSQWRSEINEALPEHQSLLGLNLGKSSRYAEKMARTKKLKETMARRR